MSDRKVTTIDLAWLDWRVSYENRATLELNDSYKAGRKVQPRIVLKDMSAATLAYLIQGAGMALRKIESNVAASIEHARNF